jgi:uncharacterized protein with PQ loop repeat
MLALALFSADASFVFRPATSRLQECNAQLRSAPSTLDALAASFVELTNSFIDSATGKILSSALPASAVSEHALTPRSFTKSDAALEGSLRLGAAPDTPTNIKKCPPVTLSDYMAWVPPLKDHIIALGYLFTVLAAVISIPQMVTIIRRKSTIGVSITTQVISLVSGANQIWNVFILDYYQIDACKHVDMSVCMPHIQPLFQAAIGYLFTLPLFVLCLVYFAKYDQDDQSNPEYDENVCCWGLSRRKTIEMWTVVGWTILFSALSLTMVYSVGACAAGTILFGRIQGAMNSVLTIFQWWPQIILTLLLKHQGSLSLTMLIIVQVTDALSIYYLMALGQDWSVWASSAVDLTMVTSLILIVIYFESCQNRKSKAPAAAVHEQDSLLDDDAHSRVSSIDSMHATESASFTVEPSGRA